MASLEEIKAQREATGLRVVEETWEGNDTGWRLQIDCNAIVSLQGSRGKNPEPIDLR